MRTGKGFKQYKIVLIHCSDIVKLPQENSCGIRLGCNLVKLLKSRWITYINRALS
jgi:hypothetical protein